MVESEKYWNTMYLFRKMAYRNTLKVVERKKEGKCKAEWYRGLTWLKYRIFTGEIPEQKTFEE
jgi:hypothetical protein